MRPDIYTKAVLTVIAVMLSVIALKPLISPDTTAQAQGGRFAGIQAMAPSNISLSFFDPKTGEVWKYDDGANAFGKFAYKYQLGKLGDDLVQTRRK
jgi:uncharacterized membrane protein